MAWGAPAGDANRHNPKDFSTTAWSLDLKLAGELHLMQMQDSMKFERGPLDIDRLSCSDFGWGCVAVLGSTWWMNFSAGANPMDLVLDGPLK